MTAPMTTAAPTYGWRILRDGKSLGLFAGEDEDAAVEVAQRAGKITPNEPGLLVVPADCPVGSRVSERALLDAQREKLMALEAAARASRETDAADVYEAALREGPETYDSALRWAGGMAREGFHEASRVKVPKAKAYVLLSSDGSRRWRAGEVGLALPNDYPEKYDVRLYLGTDVLTDEDRSVPWLAGRPTAARIFYQLAEDVAPFTQGMLPQPGEDPARFTFDVHREIERTKRYGSSWRLVGAVRASDLDEAVALATSRFPGNLRLTSANVEPSHHPPDAPPPKKPRRR